MMEIAKKQPPKGQRKVVVPVDIKAGNKTTKVNYWILESDWKAENDFYNNHPLNVGVGVRVQINNMQTHYYEPLSSEAYKKYIESYIDFQNTMKESFARLQEMLVKPKFKELNGKDYSWKITDTCFNKEWKK